jgi:hypothetical protein
MMHANPQSYRKERWIFAIRQKYLRTLHPARRFRSRPRNGRQTPDFLFRYHHPKRLTPCCHDTAPRSPLLKRGIHQHTSSSIDAGFINAGFMESVV